MKPDNKLGRIEAEPEQAFENLRKLARRIVSVKKKPTEKPISLKASKR
jgi:hypothetical protein